MMTITGPPPLPPSQLAPIVQSTNKPLSVDGAVDVVECEREEQDGDDDKIDEVVAEVVIVGFEPADPSSFSSSNESCPFRLIILLAQFEGE
jgi:hypothetical protein